MPHARWEWFWMRVLMALLVFTSLQPIKPYTFDQQPVPNGLARVMDLSFLAQPGPVDLTALPVLAMPWGGEIRLHGPGWYDTIVLAAALLGVLYLWGRGLRFTLPLLALVHTLPWTHSNSQGFIHHGYQLISMVLWVQAVVVWWWQIRKWRGAPALELPLRSYLIYYSQGMVAVSYVTCALSKLLATKGLWIFKSHHIAVELIKSHRLEYYKYLDGEAAGDPAAAVWLMNHPLLTLLLFDAGFFLELIALLALRNRAWGLLIGLSLVVFHRSVWVLMRLEFPMHEKLLLIFLVNVPFWLVWAWRQGARRMGVAPAK